MESADEGLCAAPPEPADQSYPRCTGAPEDEGRRLRSWADLESYVLRASEREGPDIQRNVVELIHGEWRGNEDGADLCSQIICLESRVGKIEEIRIVRGA